MTQFASARDSHNHSLQTLNLLYEYDDFMESVGTLIDLGSGSEGLDVEWWATRTTRDEDPLPLNIRCIAVDTVEKCYPASLSNVTYQRQDFETLKESKIKFDVLWCHDSFQYATNPLQTLKNWWNISNDDAMLALILPQTTNLKFNKLDFYTPSGCFFHYTLINLIYMLAVAGWDTKNGHFLKKADDPWIHALVYRSARGPLDSSTTWYQLCEKNLLPESMQNSIDKWGYPKQHDLVLTWLDKSITWFGKH